MFSREHQQHAMLHYVRTSKGVSGEYSVDNNISVLNSQATDTELASELWDFSIYDCKFIKRLSNLFDERQSQKCGVCGHILHVSCVYLKCGVDLDKWNWIAMSISASVLKVFWLFSLTDTSTSRVGLFNFPRKKEMQRRRTRQVALMAVSRLLSKKRSSFSSSRTDTNTSMKSFSSLLVSAAACDSIRGLFLSRCSSSHFSAIKSISLAILFICFFCPSTSSLPRKGRASDATVTPASLKNSEMVL